MYFYFIFFIGCNKIFFFLSIVLVIKLIGFLYDWFKFYKCGIILDVKVF